MVHKVSKPLNSHFTTAAEQNHFLLTEELKKCAVRSRSKPTQWGTEMKHFKTHTCFGQRMNLIFTNKTQFSIILNGGWGVINCGFITRIFDEIRA